MAYLADGELGGLTQPCIHALTVAQDQEPPDPRKTVKDEKEDKMEQYHEEVWSNEECGEG